MNDSKYVFLNWAKPHAWHLQVMGLGQKFWLWSGGVNFLMLRSGPVKNLENFPQKTSFFSIFTLLVKKPYQVGSKNTWFKGRSAPYLLWVKSLLRSGQGPSLPNSENPILPVFQSSSLMNPVLCHSVSAFHKIYLPEWKKISLWYWYFLFTRDLSTCSPIC